MLRSRFKVLFFGLVRLFEGELFKRNISCKLVDDDCSGMRILVMLLLDTLPMLGNVLLLCFFVFFIFGIMGVQMWAGLLRQRCYISEEYQQNLIYQEGYKE